MSFEYSGSPIPKDSRLVIPSANAIANLGQLAVDLIIKNKEMTRIGFISCSLVEPVVALDAFTKDSNTIFTAMEVYAGSRENIVALQLRSPVFKGLGKAFVKLLSDWIISCEFSSMILVTGIDGTKKADMNGPEFKIYAGETSDFSHDDIKVEGFESLIAGAGLSKFLLQIVSPKLDSLVVAFWTSPGDNIPAAMRVFSFVLGLLKIEMLDSNGVGLQVQLPYSWEKAFGVEMHTREIY